MPRLFLFLVFFSISFYLSAQNNSPYSRFGLGDMSPQTNVTGRGMGGISAAYSDWFSVNFNNPASYSRFLTSQEKVSKKLSAGRVVFDVGTNFESRKLIAPNTPNSFSSNDLLFSYIQVGVPLRKNWGLAFGIRPVSRVSYLINRDEFLKDPSNPNDTIERAITQFRGSGGTYLPSIGTGFALGNFSAGVNMGYLFGNREITTLRSLINDSLSYYSSQHNTNSFVGGLFFNAGVQYQVNLNEAKTTLLRLGVAGNWKQNINGSQDLLRQTFTRGAAGEEVRVDSVFEQEGVSGAVVYPSSYKAGFVVHHNGTNNSGWLFGADYSQNKWSNYRFFGKTDSVQDNWMLNVGAQLSPRSRNNYFSNVTYRFGVFAGEDYIKVGKELPIMGASFGMALPLGISRMAPSQVSIVNIGFEYMKRGNNDNLLKENFFRVSLGLNLTDLWFGKTRL